MISTFLIIGCVGAVAAGYFARTGVPHFESAPMPRWMWIILFCILIGFVRVYVLRDIL